MQPNARKTRIVSSEWEQTTWGMLLVGGIVAVAADDVSPLLAALVGVSCCLGAAAVAHFFSLGRGRFWCGIAAALVVALVIVLR